MALDDCFYSADYAAWALMRNWLGHLAFATDLKHTINVWQTRVYAWLVRDAYHLLFCFDLLFINLTTAFFLAQPPCVFSCKHHTNFCKQHHFERRVSRQCVDNGILHY